MNNELLSPPAISSQDEAAPKFYLACDRSVAVLCEDIAKPNRRPLEGMGAHDIKVAMAVLRERNEGRMKGAYRLEDAAGEQIHSGVPSHGKRDWEETSYTGQCRNCGHAFLGPKRAPMCAPCWTQAQQNPRTEPAADIDLIQRLDRKGDELSLEAAAEIARLKAELVALKAGVARAALLAWLGIGSAPDYSFSDEEPESYLVIAEKFNEPERKAVVLGHFKEDGFYLAEGGELDYNWSPVLWTAMPEKTKELPGLRAPTREEAAGSRPGEAGPQRFLIEFAEAGLPSEHFDDEQAARARLAALSRSCNVRFFAEEMLRPAAAGARSGVYMASKAVAHGPRWQKLRESFPVISTWIDECDPGATLDWPDLWARCLAEATSAEVLIVYMEPGEILKGAWVEVGAALAAGVPVIGVGIDEFSIAKSGKILLCKTIEEAVETARGIMDGNAIVADMREGNHV